MSNDLTIGIQRPIGKKGQVTIPKDFRDYLNVTEDDSVEFKVNDKGEVVISKVNNVMKESLLNIITLLGKQMNITLIVGTNSTGIPIFIKNFFNEMILHQNMKPILNGKQCIDEFSQWANAMNLDELSAAQEFNYYSVTINDDLKNIQQSISNGERVWIRTEEVTDELLDVIGCTYARVDIDTLGIRKVSISENGVETIFHP